MASITLVDGDAYFTTAPTTQISTTAISNSENYITVRVTIGHPTAGQFELLAVNQPIIIPVAKSVQTQPSSNAADPNKPTQAEVDSANVTNIRDVYRITTVYNVNGILSEEQGGDSGSTKRDNLEILSKFGGTIRLVYRTGSNQKVVNGIFTRLSIKETPSGRVSDQDSIADASPIAYDVQIAFTKGVNR